MTPFGVEASFEVYPFVDGSRRILGSNYGFAEPSIDFPRYAQLHLDGRLPIDRLVDRRIALDQLEDAFDGLARARTHARWSSSNSPSLADAGNSGFHTSAHAADMPGHHGASARRSVGERAHAARSSRAPAGLVRGGDKTGRAPDPSDVLPVAARMASMVPSRLL